MAKLYILQGSTKGKRVDGSNRPLPYKTTFRSIEWIDEAQMWLCRDFVGEIVTIDGLDGMPEYTEHEVPDTARWISIDYGRLNREGWLSSADSQ